MSSALSPTLAVSLLSPEGDTEVGTQRSSIPYLRRTAYKTTSALDHHIDMHIYTAHTHAHMHTCAHTSVHAHTENYLVIS